MKGISKIILGGFLMISISACEEENKEAAILDTDQSRMEKIMDVDAPKIWEANIETTQGFTKMNEIINEFSDFENTEAYTQLKADLLVEYKLIFKNCTMKGEAHDQLHEYIMPFSDWFKGLSSNDLEVNKSAYDAIKVHLEDYKNRFK